MKFIRTPLQGAYEIELEPIRDERGLFARTFCKNEFAGIGFRKPIVQINHSITVRKGSIRGMHYQDAPACEIKIIRCIGGSVFDVMVDLRADSATFLHWHGVELSKDSMRMVYIPEGFAHGFQTLSDTAELLYHHSEFYSPECERGLRFDDPVLSIAWPLPAGMVSDKDRNYPLVTDAFKGIEP
jgi:dTDP-4-dehydrorhamnose 3,5-epimerase